MAGTLYLIPTVISEGTQHDVIPPHTLKAIRHIRHYLVEDVRTARRFISSLKVVSNIEELQFSVLNKDSKEEDLPDLMKELFNGNDLGLMSESGCPGIADPGAKAVHFAHNKNIEVVPLIGPSSIILGLMASGLNGQQFAFHGYLPIEEAEAAQRIKELEKESRVRKQTQVFIETPYRNSRLLGLLIKHLHPATQLCVAIDLSGTDQRILSRAVKEWAGGKEKELPKTPAVFLFLA